MEKRNSVASLQTSDEKYVFLLIILILFRQELNLQKEKEKGIEIAVINRDYWMHASGS